MQVTFGEWADSVRVRRMAATLGQDEVRIWTATIPPDEADWSVLIRLLCPAEQARAGRFRDSGSRRAFVFGRALVRQLAGACLGVAPDGLSLDVQKGGKPCLRRSPAQADLRFNVSHSSALVAIGLAWGIEIGVDIERMQAMADLPFLANRIFSPDELDAWRALPEPLRLEAFFNAWTRKEAYVKATGEGLTEALPQVEVEFVPGQEAKLLRLSGDPEAASQWVLRSIPLPTGYRGAVAFPADPGRALPSRPPVRSEADPG